MRLQLHLDSVYIWKYRAGHCGLQTSCIQDLSEFIAGELEAGELVRIQD
jgi:hypothetical protein